MSEIKDDTAALLVSCPTCGAKPGEYCKYHSNRLLELVHAERRNIGDFTVDLTDHDLVPGNTGSR